MGIINKIRSSSIYTLLWKISGHAAGFLATWLLVTQLSLEEYGIYNLLLGTGTYLSVVSSFGLISAFRRYLPEFGQNKEHHKFLWTVKSGVVFRVIAATMIVLVIVLFYDEIGHFFQIESYRNYFLLFAFGLLLMLQAELFECALEALFLHKYILYANLSYTFLRLALLCFIFYLGYGLLEVLLVEFISYLVLLGLCLFYFWKSCVQTIKKKIEKFSKTHLLKRLLRYSGFSFFNEAGAVFIDISTDFLVIAHYLGPQALGYYSFAARIGRISSKFFPSRIMRTVIVPTFFARYGETGDKKELNKMFRFVSKVNAFFVFPIFSLVVVFGRQIIQYVFDPQYTDAYPVLLILLIHYIMLVFPVALPLQAVEKPEMVLIAKVSSIYNLIMDIILIQLWGIIGVAVATSSAMILKKGIEYAMSKKYVGITIPWVGVTKILFNCLVACIIGIWTIQFIDSIFSLIIVCFLTLIVYLFISYVNKAFEEEERNLINNLIGKPYFHF